MSLISGSAAPTIAGTGASIASGYIREAKSVLVSDYWFFFTVISILNPDFCTVHRYISN
jgi:hypothetical protein